jgi:hypothetical protein
MMYCDSMMNYYHYYYHYSPPPPPLLTTTTTRRARAVSTRMVPHGITTVLSLHRKEFKKLLGGLKEKILSSWVRERKKSICVFEAAELNTNTTGSTTGSSKNSGSGSAEPAMDAVGGRPVSLARKNNNTEDLTSTDSVNLARDALEQGVVLGALSEEEDDDEMNDEEDDDVEEDGEDEEDEDDDEYDSSGELDLEWKECTVLNPSIRFEDLEPRANLGAGSFGSVQLGEFGSCGCACCV